MAWKDVALITIRNRRSKNPDLMIDYDELELASRCADAAMEALAEKQSVSDAILAVLKVSGL